jgi:hypothetical protein
MGGFLDLIATSSRFLILKQSYHLLLVTIIIAFSYFSTFAEHDDEARLRV